MNDLPRAKEQYEAAVIARPTYIPARIQLGVTLLSMGDSDAASEQWNKVLETDPDNARAKMYLRMVAAARASGSVPVAPPASPTSQRPAGKS
jgi:Tfp pilus assembly protein PilF